MDISFRYAVISKTSADVSTLIETCPGPGVRYTINQRKVELASLKTGYIYGQRFLLRKFKEPLAQGAHTATAAETIATGTDVTPQEVDLDELRYRQVTPSRIEILVWPPFHAYWTFQVNGLKSRRANDAASARTK